MGRTSLVFWSVIQIVVGFFLILDYFSFKIFELSGFWTIVWVFILFAQLDNNMKKIDKLEDKPNNDK